MIVPAGATAGRFITLEGGEGAGKSTQIRRLADRLGRAGRRVKATREPGGAPGAERIRGLLVAGDMTWDPVAETLLHFAARREHVSRTVRPALEQGAWVLSDRFADSTRAYQGAGQGVPAALIEALYDMAIAPVRPDLTVILDLDPAVGLERAARRAGADEARYERMGLAFHQRLRAAFLEIAQRDPARCRVVPADGPAEVVADRIWQVVMARFPEAADG